jgi:hypothetical protein
MSEDYDLSPLDPTSIILPPPSGFADELARSASFSTSHSHSSLSIASSGHDYEEIPQDIVLEPYLSTLNGHRLSNKPPEVNEGGEEFDPDSIVPPVICGESSLLDEIDACRRERNSVLFPETPAIRLSIINEFDPLRNGNKPVTSTILEKVVEEEKMYETLEEVRFASSSPERELVVHRPPTVNFSTLPRESHYSSSSYSDSSSSGFEESLYNNKDFLPKFDDASCLGDGFQLAGYGLCTKSAKDFSGGQVEGYLYQYNEEKKDFTRLWCTLKDGMFNPFAGPLPSKKIGKKWCLETRFVTTVCSVDQSSVR